MRKESSSSSFSDSSDEQQISTTTDSDSEEERLLVPPRSNPVANRRLVIEQEEEEDVRVEPSNEREEEEIPDEEEQDNEAMLIDDPNRVRMLHTWRRGNAVMVLYMLPVTIALTTALLVDYDSECQAPLKSWTKVQICTQILSILVNFVLLVRLPKMDDSAAIADLKMRKLGILYFFNKTVNCVLLFWFFVGIAWTFGTGSTECSKTAPFLYRMCLALIIIQLVITGIIFLICCCSLFFIMFRLFYRLPENHQLYDYPRGASRAAIKALPLKKFKVEMLPKEDAVCAICLSDYLKAEKIRYLPCNHHFHMICVDKWLKANKTCPFCKKDIEESPPVVVAVKQEEEGEELESMREDSADEDSPLHPQQQV